MNYPLLQEVVVPLVSDVLATLIVPELLDFLTSLVFGKGSLSEECIEGFVFGSQ
jgi:hypothetical protein